MVFRDTFFNVKQLMVNRLIDFGIEDANINLGWTTLLTLAQNTRITINVPLNLTYSDDFSITGTLETATYRRLSNKELKLKVGNTVVATTETDANGVYSFTTSPISMGNHSFQVIFEGTNIHIASESAVINRTVGKETSVIDVETVPTAHVNGSVTVLGTLKSDDAELISDATVKLDTVSGNTLTETTNQYGQFAFVVTDIPSFNGIYADCYFEGDNYYTASSKHVPISVYQETIGLTSDKNILSYADSEYATLTVQYKDEGDMNLGAGKEINLYKVYEVDDINLTSDKDILSFADNEYATISAQLTNNDKNVKVSDEPITFKAYKSSDDSLINAQWIVNEDDVFFVENENVYDGLHPNPVIFDIIDEILKNNKSVSLEISDLSNDIKFSTTDSYESSYGEILGVNDIGIDDVLKIVHTDSKYKLYINDNYFNEILDTENLFLIVLEESSIELTQKEKQFISNSCIIETNELGVSSIKYVSSGAGDIYIQSECGDPEVEDMLIIQSFVIEDCVKYDDTSVDNTSKYAKISGNGSLTYNSQNSAYLITNGSTNWTTSLFKLSNINFPNNVKITTKVMLLTDYNTQLGIGLLNGSNGEVGKMTRASNANVYFISTAKATSSGDISDEEVLYLSSSALQKNVWYNMEILITPSNITTKLYNDTTLVGTTTQNFSILDSLHNELFFHFFGYGNQQALLKNIKIKPL